jgi:protein-S-isoprenylcysteine O-methyltransferase Ste14
VSFGNSLKMFSSLQEALVLVLMMVSVVAVLYFDMDITYKISIIAIVFAVIFLSSLATQMMRQQREIKK